MTNGLSDSQRYIGLESIESWTGKQVPKGNHVDADGQQKLFKQGDVLFGRLRPYLAKVYRARVEGVCTGELFVLQPNQVTQDFLFYCMLSRNFVATVDSSTYGAKMPRASWESMGKIPVPIPPDNEQERIGAFLDHRLEEIDAVIEKKRQQIRLLLEKRDALINQTATRGLDASATVKDSGVEWMGRIPANWNVIRSKHVLVEIDDRSTTGEEELLTVSHITGVTPRSEKNVNMFMSETLEGYKKCKPGDLVINTMWAWAGAIGTAYQDGVVSPSYNVYRFIDKNTFPPYYDKLFRTRRFREEMRRHSKGVWVSRLRLYPAEFFQISIPIPPREEQANIVRFLSAKVAVLDGLTDRIQTSISELRDYRSAVVEEVSTGKINVQLESM